MVLGEEAVGCARPRPAQPAFDEKHVRGERGLHGIEAEQSRGDVDRGSDDDVGGPEVAALLGSDDVAVRRPGELGDGVGHQGVLETGGEPVESQRVFVDRDHGRQDADEKRESSEPVQRCETGALYRRLEIGAGDVLDSVASNELAGRLAVEIQEQRVCPDRLDLGHQQGLLLEDVVVAAELPHEAEEAERLR